MPRTSTTSGENARPKNARPKKDPQLVELGARLRSLRDAAGKTQEALADAADVHWTYVGQIERGERNPTYKNLLKLAHGLDSPLSEVLEGL